LPRRGHRASTAAAVKAGFDIEVVKSLEPGKPRDPDKHSCLGL
jgi:hypothetical protein